MRRESWIAQTIPSQHRPSCKPLEHARRLARLSVPSGPVCATHRPASGRRDPCSPARMGPEGGKAGGQVTMNVPLRLPAPRHSGRLDPAPIRDRRHLFRHQCIALEPTTSRMLAVPGVSVDCSAVYSQSLCRVMPNFYAPPGYGGPGSCKTTTLQCLSAASGATFGRESVADHQLG